MSISIMERCFNKSVTDILSKWHFNSDTSKKLSMVYEEVRLSSEDQFEYLAQCGAL